MIPDLKNKLFLFFKRLIISTILIAAFFIAIQDIIIFPGALTGLLTSKSIKADIPEEVEEHFIKTKDGKSIQVWKYKDEEKTTSNNLAIILTGNADTLTRGGYFYQRYLANLGLPSIAFSYRGYGKSTGWPSEKGLKNDIDAVYNFAKKTARPKKILIFAISIGTGPGTYIALKEKVSSLVLISPYTSLKKVAKDIPFYRFLTPFLRTNFSSEEIFSKNNSFPCTVIVHGLDDTTILPKHSSELFKLLPKEASAKLLTYKGAGHNDIMSYAKEELGEEINRCLSLRKEKP